MLLLEFLVVVMAIFQYFYDVEAIRIFQKVEQVYDTEEKVNLILQETCHLLEWRDSIAMQ